MEVDQPYLYRGTTLGWAGSESARRESRTCATSDPLVATLFAVHCLNFGRAVVHLVSRHGLPECPGNRLEELEKEVVVEMPPVEFADRAVVTLSARESGDILRSIGLALPPRIASGYNMLGYALEDWPRMTSSQIAEFDRLALES